MELDFDNDEFESFLKQKADQYKMYPSESVWKGISFVQHSRTRLITIGGSLLLISVFFFFGGRFFTDQSTTANRPVQENTRVITSLSSGKSSTVLAVSPENARKSVAVATDIALKNQVLESKADKPVNLAASRPKRGLPSESSNATTGSSSSSAEDPLNVVMPSLPSTSFEKEQTFVSAGTPATTTAGSSSNAPDLSSANVPNIPARIDAEQASDKSVNWLQEIAAIKLRVPKKNRFNVQFYFSPMVSYRRLVDNNGFKGITSTNNTPSGATISMDKFVDHKPAIGVEVGSNIIYSVGRSLTLKTGVQLNYSRYTIKAYKSYSEKASIALNSVGQQPADTIVSYTTLRNYNGYSPEVLENQYLQVSVPVGAELVLLGKKKLQFSIAGTVQPTYLIFNDAYLLTTDYEHYTKEPSLVRKWNVHTSAEAFISYKSGGLRWQVGPQFRYQMMPSYNDRYPIKEYLMEYGIKFGISKTLR